LYHVVDHVSQASQIGMAVAVVDSVAHVMKLMGFHFQVRGHRWVHCIDDVSDLIISTISSVVFVSGMG
jgi:hypothetical protein